MSGKYSLEEGMAAMKTEMPELMGAFGALMERATGDGLLSAKTKRLMMIAVSVTQRCQQCIRVHVKAAAELGASRAEILEASGIAVLMAGGPAMANVSTVVMEALEEAGL